MYCNVPLELLAANQEVVEREINDIKAKLVAETHIHFLIWASPATVRAYLLPVSVVWKHVKPASPCGQTRCLRIDRVPVLWIKPCSAHRT